MSVLTHFSTGLSQKEVRVALLVTVMFAGFSPSRVVAPAWFALLIFALFGSYYVISRLFALGLGWFASILSW